LNLREKRNENETFSHHSKSSKNKMKMWESKKRRRKVWKKKEGFHHFSSQKTFGEFSFGGAFGFVCEKNIPFLIHLAIMWGKFWKKKLFPLHTLLSTLNNALCKHLGTRAHLHFMGTSVSFHVLRWEREKNCPSNFIEA